MNRRARAGWLALAASVLLHAALLGGLAGRLPVWEAPVEAPAIEARLVERARPAAPPAPRLRVRPEAVAAPAALPAPVQRAVQTEASPAAPAPLPDADAAGAAMAEPDAAGIAADAPPSAPRPTVAHAPQPVVDEPPPLNPLPPRIDLHFSVHYGVAGGEQTLVWVSDGERYTLTSVASATGLAGLFYRGRLVQTSQGRITPAGLQPEEFWDQRGDRRSSARFDHAAARVTLTPVRGAPRHLDGAGDTQDLLSVLFQLVLTAPPETAVRYVVFNGKRLRTYTLEPRGETELETALGPLRTLHLARAATGGDRFEIWLAVDHNYLPVRLLRGDDEGSAVELRILAIAP
jgi:hypothetical protein